MTVKEALETGVKTLEVLYDAGEAKAISEWLIEYLTSEKIAGRPLALKRELSFTEETGLQNSLARLKKNEPLQYVINESWFCGLKFYVDNNVLIPRPETEELVEWIISDCKFPIAQLTIFDLGTGSGCIPIALKRRLGKASMFACDTSEAALKIARKNAIDIGVEVNFFNASILKEDDWELFPEVDNLVSNPPYIPEDEKSSISKNVIDFEPSLALFVPQNDPLIFYKKIAGIAQLKLKPSGYVYLEIHPPFVDQLEAYFLTQGFRTEVKTDMQGMKRMMRLSKML